MTKFAAAHFTLPELVKSDLATRHGIINTPPEDVVASLSELARNVLDPIRFHYGKPVFVRSGYRCLELNTLCGSKETSQHTKGEAADIEVPGVSNLALAKWIAANLTTDQCILEFPPDGWVHVSYTAKSRNRKQLLTITKDGTFPDLPEG